MPLELIKYLMKLNSNLVHNRMQRFDLINTGMKADILGKHIIR
jgi:hypothetical protein